MGTRPWEFDIGLYMGSGNLARLEGDYEILPGLHKHHGNKIVVK